MDSHSKREVLEIFNISKKNVIAGFLFLNPPPICQSWSRGISRLINNIYTFKFLRMEFFIFTVPNFIFSSTICAEGIANHFSQVNQYVPALELLDVVKALRSFTLYVKVE